MNLKITMMELKRLKKTIIIGLVSPMAYAALIMVFYIAFAGVLNEVTEVFENPSIKGLLKAFSMDTNTFSYILNFYTAYNGIYVLLMGIAFASVLSVNLFPEELKDGTYEFLYGNPLSRIRLFTSKAMVVVIYLVVLNIAVFLVGFVSIELLKTKSPLIPWMSEDNQTLIIGKVEKELDKMMEVFVFDDTLFYDVIYLNMESQFSMMPTESDFNTEMVSDLMTIFILDPDSIYDELLDNKDKYMDAFNIKSSEENQFVKLIELQKANYFYVKENFSKDSDLALSFFVDNPKPFLDQLIDLDNISKFKNIYGFTDKEINKIFIHYSLNNFIELSFITFLVMLSMSLFVMMLTILVPKGRMSTGMAIGICMIFYMINVVSNITEQARGLRYITPLSYLNMDVMATNYQTELWALLSMGFIIVGSLILSVIAFSKKDFIS